MKKAFSERSPLNVVRNRHILSKPKTVAIKSFRLEFAFDVLRFKHP